MKKTEKNAKKFNARRLRYGANNTVLIVGAIVVFVLLNLAASALSEKFPATRIDMTGTGMFEIGAATKNVLAELDETGDDVTVYYMKNKSDEYTEVKELVLKYLGASKNLKYEVVYYIRDPKFTERFEEASGLSEGSLIVEDADTHRSRIIRMEDMVDYTTDNYSQSRTPSSLILESQLTNALAYCISRTDTVVGFTVGHQEADPNAMAQVLVNENITPMQQDLSEPVPEDVSLLVIMSPTVDFTAAEIENLDAYFDRGGNVQLAVEPTISLPRLEAYLAEWGVTFDNNYVIEGDARYSAAQYGLDIMYPQISSDAGDIISADSQVIGSLCRSVSVDDDPSGVVTHKPVFYTTKNARAFNVTDPNDEGTSGVYNLCVYLEKSVGEDYSSTAKLLVAGSSSFWGISNYEELNDSLLTQAFQEERFGNRAFFVGGVYSMTGLSGTKLTITGKSLNSASMVVMTDAQKKIYRVLFCYALPAVIVLLGLAIWLRRRHL